jgi:hypothetical protein
MRRLRKLSTRHTRCEPRSRATARRAATDPARVHARRCHELRHGRSSPGYRASLVDLCARRHSRFRDRRDPPKHNTPRHQSSRPDRCLVWHLCVGHHCGRIFAGDLRCPRLGRSRLQRVAYIPVRHDPTLRGPPAELCHRQIPIRQTVVADACSRALPASALAALRKGSGGLLFLRFVTLQEKVSERSRPRSDFRD